MGGDGSARHHCSACSLSNKFEIGVRTCKSECSRLSAVFDKLIENGGKSAALAFAGADAYLELIGKTAGGAMMARAAVAAQNSLSNGNDNPSFYEAKLTTARFFALHVLPKTLVLASEITEGSEVVLSLPEDAF